MGARGSPRNGRPSWRLWDALSSDGPATAKGRVGWRKNITPVGDRAAGDGETFPEVYSGLAAAGVTPWSYALRNYLKTPTLSSSPSMGEN